MDQKSQCQRCGARVTGQSFGDFCASCLLTLALDPPAEEKLPMEETKVVTSEKTLVRYFGDYELLEEIARGGMGVVYKARQVTLNRIVALKMILGGDFSSSLAIERFRTEAEAAARLSHPNIVPIFEIGNHEGQQYFSMRFLSGGTLTQALAREKFNSRRAAVFIIKIARAVHHAHQRGILHRDLKPGNILLDEEGTPHVADFGLAKVLEQDSSMTQSMAIMGTPNYMAPEQASGNSKAATTAVDIYSIGAVLYHLLADKAPFGGETPLAVLAKVRDEEPISPRSLNEHLDVDLSVICLKCLEKDPDRRYGSAEALAEDLQHWLDCEPIQARPVRWPERVLKWARRKPVIAALNGLIALVGLSGIAGILWQSKIAKTEAFRATEEAQRASIEAANAREHSERAETELWNANFNEARALRSAGGPGARVESSRILQKLIQRPGLSSSQVLALRQEAIAQMALVDIALPTNWISKISWVPLAWNSSLSGYIRNTGSNFVEVCEYPSEKVIGRFAGPPRSTLSRAIFGGDDQILAVRFSNAAGEVRVWNIATGELIVKTTGSQSIFLSPDNRTLGMTRAGGVALQPLTPNSRHRYLQQGRHARWAVFSPDSKKIAVLPSSGDLLEIWDASSGETVHSSPLSFNPYQAAWHPAGNMVLLGGMRGQVEALEFSQTKGGEPRTTVINGHANKIYQLLFSPDKSMAITYALDRLSILRDTVSWRPLLRENRVTVHGINSAGNRVITSKEGHGPQREGPAILMPRTGFRTMASMGEVRPALGLCTSRDGRLGIVTYAAINKEIQGVCLLWDMNSGVEIARLRGLGAVFSSDSQSLFVFQYPPENRVLRYDVSSKTLAKRPIEWSEGMAVYNGRNREKVNTGVFSGDGRTLIIAASAAVVFFDTLRERPVTSWSKPAHYVKISADGKWVATDKQNLQPVLREGKNGRAILRSPAFSTLKISPDSRWVIAATSVAAQIYSLKEVGARQMAVDNNTLSPIYEPIPLDGGGLTPPLAFSPDSKTLAIVFNRTHVRLYETTTGREIATLSPPNPAQIQGGSALDFSADGQWLLAANDDGETIGWNIPIIRSELAKLGLNWEDPK